MSIRPPAPRRRGFTLIELLVVVLLLAVFSVVIAELFMATMKAQREAAHRDTLLRRLDTAVSRLRHDTWSASSIDADGTVVQLPSANGHRVTWRYSRDGKLSRTTNPPSAEQTWGELPPVAFTAHGALLTMTLKAVDRDETVTFASQQMEGAAK
jgi:prepilin-type N-terminal cleavage/methylation domain-containing protein